MFRNPAPQVQNLFRKKKIDYNKSERYCDTGMASCF